MSATERQPVGIVAKCENCHRTTFHELTESESIDGPAWQCTGCGIVVESIQTTVRAAVGAEVLRP